MSPCRFWILAAGLWLAFVGPSTAAEEVGQGYSATLAQEVRRPLTDPYKHHCLVGTARLVPAHVGHEATDKVSMVVPRTAHAFEIPGGR